MRKFLIVAATSLAPFSAFAADLPSRFVAPVAPAAPVFTWTGFYAGVNAGVNWTRRNTEVTFSETSLQPVFQALEYDPGFTSESWTAALNNSKAGFIGGVHIGYNHQINNFVVGIEADFMGTSVSNTNSVTFATAGYEVGFAVLTPGYQATTLSNKVEQNWLGTVRLRAGMVFDRLFIYGTGGLAYGNVKSTVTMSREAQYYVTSEFGEAAVNSWSASRSKTNFGYALGAGAEYALSANWTIRAEYLYYNLGKVSSAVSGTIGGEPAPLNFNGYYNYYQTDLSASSSTKVSGNIVRAALSYKF